MKNFDGTNLKKAKAKRDEINKLDRKALPKPDAKDFRNEYEAPTNDTEKALRGGIICLPRIKRYRSSTISKAGSATAYLRP